MVAENDQISLTHDPIKLRAASFSLQTISEAVRNIPPELLARYDGIEWAKIKGMGNITRHEYFRIDPNILWETMTSELDGLAEAMRVLLKASKRI